MIRKLYTIGYEGLELHQFISTLNAFDVDVLLDVRELPASRRRGFSKSALKEAVESAGIRYISERRLGTPRELRKRVRETKDYDAFFAEFAPVLAAQRGLVRELVRELDGAVALMCYEHDPHHCHRLPVAAAFARVLRRKPVHL